MWTRLLQADIRRHAAVALPLALLITVCAALAATSTHVAVSSTTAISAFMDRANPPTVVQMHKGELDTGAIETWAASRPDVADLQIIQTLPVPNHELWFGNKNQGASVLEPALVTAPERFDLLLDTDGAPASPRPGEVFLPVQYEIDGELAVGDQIRVGNGPGTKTLRVAGFIQDAQMGSTLVTSKRILVHHSDFAVFQKRLEPEYLIEFELTPGADVTRFSSDYTMSGLPQQGILVDESIFALMNGLSTFLIVGVVLLVAVILLVVALITLRLAVLSALAREIRPLGTLRAIGVPRAVVMRIFLAKHMLIATVSAAIGTAVSFPLAHRVGYATLRRVGEPPSAFLPATAALVTGLAVVAIVMAFAASLLRSFNKKTTAAVLTLRPGGGTRRKRSAKLVSTRLDPHMWLGLDAVKKPTMFLLALVIAVCTTVATLPAAVSDTVAHPSFSTYLGVGKADVRLDLRDPSADADAALRTVEGHESVKRSVLLNTHRLEVFNKGEWENVVVETGNHAAFPLSYQHGTAPHTHNDIALSHANAQGLGVNVGDTTTLRVNGEKRQLRVTGIYQDMTNGGRTAKVSFPIRGTPIWRVIYISAKTDDAAPRIMRDVSSVIPNAKVTDIDNYSEQVMGSLMGQLRTASSVALLIAAAVASLVASLVAVLTLARDRSSISALHSIGANRRGLQRQYFTQFAVVAAGGTLCGAVIVQTVGQKAVSAVLGFLGAPAVAFTPGTFTVWGIPAIFVMCTLITVRVVLRRIDSIHPNDEETS